MDRRAKIVATLGPASANQETLERLLEEGVDVARLNMSHGTHDSHRRLIQRLRKLAGRQQRFVPVIVDLMGPRYRLGEIPDGPLTLTENAEVFLGPPDRPATSPSSDLQQPIQDLPVQDLPVQDLPIQDLPIQDLPIQDPEILRYLRPGERLVIDHGLIELEVTGCLATGVAARVGHGGSVATRKGINLPDSDLPFTISDKDRDDIAFALREGADYLAVSFVGGPADLAAIRAVLAELGGMLPLIAKLERAAPLRHLDETVEASDAVMVARGDLGVEVPVHDVPVLQKKIIAAGRRVGKPVIVATQMLETMVESARPTRAEVSDVAHAVVSGVDAVMLSAETASGAHPVATVETMDRIIRQTEAYLWRRGAFGSLALDDERERPIPFSDALANSTAQLSRDLRVRSIVVVSQGGTSAATVSSARPAAPVIAISASDRTCRRMNLLWGVVPIRVKSDDLIDPIPVCRYLPQELGLAKPGEFVLLVRGFHANPEISAPSITVLRV